MTDGGIRNAGPADAALLAVGLARLSAELEEPHRMDAAGLAAALAAPSPPFRAVLAGGDGLVLYSPAFSTVAGGAGVYVSDIWVSPAARGVGLGRRLLAAASRDAAAQWGAIHVTLAVYDHCRDARAFYDRLGFRALTGQSRLMLDADATAALKGEP